MQERLSTSIGYIHNMWLKELVQGGIAAIMALLLLLFRGFYNSTTYLVIDSRDDAARARLAFLVAMLASTQFNPSGTAVFWMLLGEVLVRTCRVASKPAQRVSATEMENSSLPLQIIARKHTILAEKKKRL